MHFSLYQINNQKYGSLPPEIMVKSEMKVMWLLETAFEGFPLHISRVACAQYLPHIGNKCFALMLSTHHFHQYSISDIVNY
jgi:hypothetical protein